MPLPEEFNKTIDKQITVSKLSDQQNSDKGCEHMQPDEHKTIDQLRPSITARI